ncbi:hypothetical protein LIER_32741 [Lithospermum erythrorhizon]|uniref:Syntaxin 6/10/61 N-terminal domain-containing protein n=1 Tax=Lithospermum erythrorhizon TaxID=34254 RepID=A0AAV3RWG5_LITER
MLVANTFDQWQRDTFFSAAEEVQHSADVMESAYRIWIRERREGAEADSLDKFSRDLQMALGTAKWQLEEFERAVGLSYTNRADKITITRHRQFVSAIEDQISRVEAALREAINMEGKLQLPWVNLDEKERDDLALFLSSSSTIPQSTKDGSSSSEKYSKHISVHPKSDIPDQSSSSNDIPVSNLGSHHSIELGVATPQLRLNVDCQSDYRTNNHKTWSSSDIGKLDIVIKHKDKFDNPSFLGSESTSKEKGQGMIQKCEDLLHGKRQTHILPFCRKTNWMNQISGKTSSHWRLLQSIPVKSKQTMLLLMLTIFLVVAFLLYSN